MQAEIGARQRWRGELVLQVIGTASPGFELLLATEYPSRQCYLTALADERSAYPLWASLCGLVDLRGVGRSERLAQKPVAT